MKRNKLVISNRVIGKDLFFFVEEGQTSKGNVDLALELIDASAEIGADGIEFQLFRAEDFYVRKHPVFKLYREREFSNEDIIKLIKRTKKNKIAFIATVFSSNLVPLLVDSGCDCFMISSSDIDNPEIIDKVSLSNLPFFLNLALASEKEIDWIINNISKKNINNCILLHSQHALNKYEHGVPIDKTQLGCIKSLKSKYDMAIGFIDHTSCSWLPAVAVASGAQIVSKHICLERGHDVPDRNICFDPDELKAVINNAREIYISINNKNKKLIDGEKIDKKLMRRSVVAAVEIKKGEKITKEKIRFKRPGIGLSPSRYKEILGLKSKKYIKVDDVIIKKYLEK